MFGARSTGYTERHAWLNQTVCEFIVLLKRGQTRWPRLRCWTGLAVDTMSGETAPSTRALTTVSEISLVYFSLRMASILIYASTLSLVQLLNTSLSYFISTLLLALFAQPLTLGHSVPGMGSRTLGKRSFQYIGHGIWNSLPLSVRHWSSLS